MIGSVVVCGEEEVGLQKQCAHCLDWWPCDAEFFYRDNARKDGLNSYCKACWDEIKRRPSKPRALPLRGEHGWWQSYTGRQPLADG
jgi:hypothetical protein